MKVRGFGTLLTDVSKVLLIIKSRISTGIVSVEKRLKSGNEIFAFPISISKKIFKRNEE